MAKVSQIKLPDGTLFDINDTSKVNEESIFSSNNENAYGYIYNRPGEVEGVGIYYSNIQDPLTSETEASVGGISVSYSNMTMGIENQNHWSTISMLADSRDNSVSIGCGYLSDDTPVVNTIIVDPTSTQITNLVYPNNDSDAASKEYVDDEVATKADIATTLSGYGITDASISDRTITLGSNTITVPENMVILSYGHSTWNDFINVYNTNRVVYCRASSNANPASGSQTRLAFMAYVNNADSPTNVEFQYYRSVSSHSASQQGDQVYVYKLESANGGKWTVTVRESYTKIVAGTNMTSSYSSGVLTLNATQPDISGKADIASTLAGYGIEDAYISNGTITLGSDTITPLTSFTESDPIFVASAAYGISSSDITTWNGKQSPATTLSGYGITDAKIENGTITLGSNSITPLTSFTETDPTVPSWAKESTKPTYTASEVGAIASSLKGASNGVAELDANGLVPSSQLPSYVDDVLEYATKSSFPATGETGKIYVDLATNLTYRWSGSAYVEISPSLALGTTSSTAFRGDYGQSAYTHAVTNKGSAFTSGLYKITTNSEGHVTNAVAVTSSDIPGLSSKADSATTLAGYGITDATIQNGTITLGSNSITPLTSYTETDPIFTASAAYGISSTDITNWNSKSDTDEKVKAVDNGDSGLSRYLVMGTASGNAETKYYNTTLSFANTSNASILTIGNGSHKGQIEFYTGTNNYAKTKLVSTATNTTRTISFPDSDGTVALASTTLAGYGITDAKIQNGTITLGSNTITPLTSYTETDPVFTASVAYGITNDNIANWNNKADAETTLAGYGIIDAYISNGTITLGSNSITPVTSSALADYIASDEIGKVYVSDTEPSTSNNYDIWIDTSTTLQNADGVMV